MQNLLPCKCGAPLNKIVVNTTECTLEFGKKRVILCSVCGRWVDGWITAYAGEDTAESKWNLANAVQVHDEITPPTPQEPESCATCRFFFRPSKGTSNGVCRRYPPVPFLDSEGDLQQLVAMSYHEGWCGEWKAVKS